MQRCGTAIQWFSGRIRLIPSVFDWTSAERLVGVLFESHRSLSFLPHVLPSYAAYVYERSESVFRSASAVESF